MRLELVYTLIAYRGFESLSVRQKYKACISRKTPKYRLFCYLQKSVSTANSQSYVQQMELSRNVQSEKNQNHG